MLFSPSLAALPRPISLFLLPSLSHHPSVILWCSSWRKKPGAQKEQTSHNHTVSASTGLLVPYRSRPRDGHGAGVAAPPLWRLPVLFVGSFKNLLHIADVVLAHGWHVYVTPEQSGKARQWISDVWQQTPSDKLLVILWQVAPEFITQNARGTFRNQKYMG